jgi:GNAT superfamily N-acetyltransferase
MAQLDLADGYYELPAGKMANVVTCLEMLTPPQPLPEPLPASYSLRQFSTGELVAYRELFRAVGAPWLWFSRLVMPDEQLAARLADPLVFAAALHDGQQNVGLLELDFRTPGVCEVVQFGLVPGQTGQGLGRKLMDAALTLAWTRGVERVWLHTCTFDSPRAVPFYVRCGFTPYARMIEIHDDPRLTGKLPKDAAPQIPLIDRVDPKSTAAPDSH